MHLEDIRLINFKNYADQAFSFSKEINCFVGDNGAGKTNILDAIHYLSITKSFQNTTDFQSIRHEESFFSILGTFKKNSHIFRIGCQLKRGEKKIILNNNNPYEKISDHIGLFPVVLITPNDTDIIRGGNEIRRKYFDSVMAQLDRMYLEDLLEYNHALKQRNAILKQAEKSGRIDEDLIEPYNAILLTTGRKICQYRRNFMKSIVPDIQRHYEDISDQKEAVTVLYASDMEEENFERDFRHSIQRDLALGRTGLGIHRDDYRIEIDGHPIRKFGSQGQQKSMIIALKLAQFDVMREKNQFKPVLLLDDIFDKLDNHRIKKIMKMVGGHAFGQIFVTDAHPERALSVFRDVDADKKIYTIHNGKASVYEWKE